MDTAVGPLLFLLGGFPPNASHKQPACRCRRHKRHRFNPWVGNIPWRKQWQPLQCSCLENLLDRGGLQSIASKRASKRLSTREHTHRDRYFMHGEPCSAFLGNQDWEVVLMVPLMERASLVAQRLKHLPGMWETRVRSLSWEDPLEKEMATHSSTLSWRIPWREEPGRLQSRGRKESDTTERLHFLSYGDAQSSMQLWTGQTRTLKAASSVSEIQLGLDTHLKADVSDYWSDIRSTHQSSAFWKAPWRCLFRFSAHFWTSEMLSRFCRDLCTRLPTAAVFIVRVNWNPDCLSIHQQAAVDK